MTFLLPPKDLKKKDIKTIQPSGWHDLPSIISETIVHKFIYWNQQPQSGMRYGNEIYTLLRSYPLSERLKACDIACEYTDRGIEVCITASKTAYSVWLNLRSLSTDPDALSEAFPQAIPEAPSGS